MTRRRRKLKLTTLPCVGCGEPTRAYVAALAVQCEVCSGAKRALMCDTWPGRARGGVDPAAVDLNYHGRGGDE